MILGGREKMTDKNQHQGLNIEVDEDNTTRAANDVFEKAKLKFPCDFPLSVVGQNVPEYQQTVTDIIKKHVPEFSAAKVSLKYSNGDKYCSLRTHFRADSREQMDELYRELTAHPLVKWVI